MFVVELIFRADLSTFLHRQLRGEPVVRRHLNEKTAIKDVIESCGIPHTEVDLIVLLDPERPVDFTWQVDASGRFEIHPSPVSPTVLPDTPRLQLREHSRFVTDGHLGKLARHLRLMGFDTAYERDADDRRLLEVMQAENRALLTRDRRLLMHSAVRHGYCPRSDNADEQIREVIARFRLGDAHAPFAPYTRCLRCNAAITPVAKTEVLAQLASEPRTLRYYDSFRRCLGCGQIYWQGTHFEKLARRIERLTDRSRPAE